MTQEQRDEVIREILDLLRQLGLVTDAETQDGIIDIITASTVGMND